MYYEDSDTLEMLPVSAEDRAEMEAWFDEVEEGEYDRLDEDGFPDDDMPR